jgi:hypothetical protein
VKSIPKKTADTTVSTAVEKGSKYDRFTSAQPAREPALTDTLSTASLISSLWRSLAPTSHGASTLQAPLKGVYLLIDGMDRLFSMEPPLSHVCLTLNRILLISVGLARRVTIMNSK